MLDDEHYAELLHVHTEKYTFKSLKITPITPIKKHMKKKKNHEMRLRKWQDKQNK